MTDRKALDESLDALRKDLDEVVSEFRNKGSELDQRAVAVAATHLETALLWLKKAIG